MSYTIKFDRSKCDNCYDCVRVCPVEVWSIVDGKVIPDSAEECTGCRTCEFVCELDAITVED